MKFLLGVLIIRFIVEAVAGKKKVSIEVNDTMMNSTIYHPSEHQLR